MEVKIGKVKDRAKKLKLQHWILGAVIVLAIIAIAIGVQISRNKNRTYVSYDVEKSKDLSGEQMVGIESMQKGVFLYSRDGAKLVDPDGEVLWNVAYNMSNPIASVCGNCAAVADREEKKFYIFDGTGSANPIDTEYPIQKVSVANQGVTAVWMDDGTSDYIILYDVSGNVLVEMNTLTIASGFPVDIAISPDGKKLVTAYISFVDEEICTQLTFYNFGEVGANYVDGLVGLEKFEGRLMADVAFASNDRIVAFGDTGFVLYSMEEIHEKITEVEIAEPIVRVAYSEDYIGVMTETSVGGSNYAVSLYNGKGQSIEQKQFVEKYEHFQIDDQDVLLYNDLQIYVFRVNGKDKFSATVAKNINHIHSIDGKNRFLFVGDSVMERVRLIGEK